MRTIVKLPRVGETAEIMVILEWLVTLGAIVSEGDPMVRIETDKVTVDVPVPVSGQLIETLVEPDDEVAVGASICVIDTSLPFQT